MSDEFEEILVEKLFSCEEIDWEEDRVTLRVMSEGQFSDTEEAEVWGKTLATVSSVIVNKLMGKYSKSPSKVTLPQLFDTIQTSFIKEIASEVRDLSDNEELL